MALANPEAMARDSARSRNMRRSISGLRARSSTRMNAASRAAAAAMPLTTGTDSHPPVWASEKLTMRPPSPTSRRALPDRSRGWRRLRGSSRGRTARPRATQATPTGTFSQKIHRQPTVPAMAPPTDGPMRSATEIAAMYTPSACGIRSAGSRSSRMAALLAQMTDVPTARPTCSPISAQDAGAKPASRLAAV